MKISDDQIMKVVCIIMLNYIYNMTEKNMKDLMDMVGYDFCYECIYYF